MRSLRRQLILAAGGAAASMLLACGGGDTADRADPYGCGGPYSKAELDEAWAHFQEVGKRGSKEAEGVCSTNT